MRIDKIQWLLFGPWTITTDEIDVRCQGWKHIGRLLVSCYTRRHTETDVDPHDKNKSDGTSKMLLVEPGMTRLSGESGDKR